MLQLPKLMSSAAFLFIGATTQSFAELQYPTSGGGFILVYGQADPAYLSFDDSVSVTDEFADNTNSNSRVGLCYRNPTDTGEFSVNLETSFGLGRSALLSQNNTSDSLEWRTPTFGKLSQFGMTTVLARCIWAKEACRAMEHPTSTSLAPRWCCTTQFPTQLVPLGSAMLTAL